MYLVSRKLNCMSDTISFWRKKMNKISRSLYGLLMSILLFTTISCDSPRTRRNLSTGSNQAYNPAGLGQNRIDQSSSSFVTPTTGSTGSSSSQQTSEANIAKISDPGGLHCKFSANGIDNFTEQSVHISGINVCQSSQDKNTFFVQIKEPNSNSQGETYVSICVIPMNASQSTGKSIHLDNASCEVYAESKTVRKITFSRTSSWYTAYSQSDITNLMVFKNLPEYYYGLNYKIKTLNALEICRQDPTQQRCADFKAAGKYMMSTIPQKSTN